jgi:tetratricopeptide (TPR) repeat protein
VRVPFAARATALGAAACLTGAIALHVQSRTWLFESEGTGGAELYVRSGETLKRMALSYDAILADIYWIRAVQYFGGTRLDTRPGRSYDRLYPLLDIATTLDPQFNIAYRFGAVFLAEAYPNGPGQPDSAIRLLKKGFAANPTRWQYLHDIGFVYYWWLRDYQGAARWFERARAVPGAPEWLAPLAAVTLTKGGDRAGARALWEHMLETGEHEYLRRIARHRLGQLRVLDDLDVLNARLARVREKTGHPATSWAALAPHPGVAAEPPLDPAGVPYVLDPATGLASVSTKSPYYPLPLETQPRPGPQP